MGAGDGIRPRCDAGRTGRLTRWRRWKACSPRAWAIPRRCCRARAALENARRMGRDGAHLSLTARDGGGRLRGVMFSAGERAAEGATGECDLLFSPEDSTPGRGARAWNWTLKAMEPLDARAQHWRRNADKRARCVYRFLTEMLYNREIDPRARRPSRPADVRALLAASPQGTLLAALERGAGAVPAGYAGGGTAAALRSGRSAPIRRIPRAFNAVCLLPAGAPPRNYRRLIRTRRWWRARRDAQWFGGTSGRGRPARTPIAPCATSLRRPAAVRRAGGAVPPAERGVRPDPRGRGRGAAGA